MTTDQQPARRFRLGSITITFWPNHDSKGRAFYTTAVTRRVRDRSGQWSDTGSMRTCDLPTVRELAAEAQEWATAHPLANRTVPAMAPDAAVTAVCALIEQQFTR